MMGTLGDGSGTGQVSMPTVLSVPFVYARGAMGAAVTVFAARHEEESTVLYFALDHRLPAWSKVQRLEAPTGFRWPAAHWTWGSMEHGVLFASARWCEPVCFLSWHALPLGNAALHMFGFQVRPMEVILIGTIPKSWGRQLAAMQPIPLRDGIHWAVAPTRRGWGTATSSRQFQK